jgi:GR25 family glycosyltransferase involved in LPS biosynthesis
MKDLTLNSYFEKIYCINLESRKDRWEQSLIEFKEHNLITDRYNAIDGKIVNSLGRLSRGEHGCLLSHLNVIKDAKENNLSKILVLEDDVEFSENMTQKFFTYIEELDDWDIIYFGAYHSLNNPYNPYPLLQITDHFYKTIHSVAAHCYAVNSTVYDALIEEISKKSKPLDDHHTEIQKKFKCFVIRPHLAWQKPSFSDIGEQYADYQFLKL